MNVMACWDLSRPAKGNGTLMVEFNEDDWTLDSVVENCVGTHITFPRKIGFIQMGTDFVLFDLAIVIIDVAYIQVNQCHQLVTMRFAQTICDETCERHNDNDPLLVIPVKGCASASRARAAKLKPPCC